MLGQLLHSFNPNRRGPARQPNNVLESVTEDSHTYNLLFPDATQLAHSDAHAFPLNGVSSNASTYDASQAGIDLDQNRDIRIIIAQDEAGAMARTVLFDSKPNSPSVDSPTTSAASDRRASRQAPSSYSQSAFTIAHGRRASLALDRNSPQPATSAFQRARTRNASISGMPHIEEGAAQRRSKEAEELVNTCMECMFGSAPWSYRGTSSKLHILPMESRTSDRSVTSPILGEGYSSFGRAEGRKRSGLATSFTPSNFPEPQTASNGLPEASQKEPRRRTILITRLFSVSPPEDVDTPAEANSNTTTPTPGTSVGTTNSFPFPHVSTGNSQGSIRKGPKPQYRTPMYAIGILLHLPVATSTNRSGGAQKTDRGQDSLGSSFDSERRAGWAFLDASTGDSLLNAANSDVDDRVDVIGQHWDVITRTLAHLHFVVQRKIVELFKLQEASTPQFQTPSRPSNGIRNGYREMPMNRRSLLLQGHALQFEHDIKTVVENSAERLVRGMKIPRVVTGQGRWGVWREEARWLGRWAGAKEQNFFLFNLLTAFLGTHTEWLNVVAPKSYRAKHRAQQKMNAGDDITVSSRTVLVSPDKMAARRLIFLLATFLPASSHAVYDGASPARPSTAASARGYSQSPPSNATLSRQQSLRRAINKKGHKSYPNMSVLNVSEGSSQSKEGNGDDRPPSRSAPHSRRPSEVRSIRSVNTTGLTIPSMAEDGGARKAHTTTTSTATPDSAVPVAHFAVQRTGSIASGSNDPRPPSSGSLASVNLRQNLQRTSTTNTSNQSMNSGSSKGWSSLINFWSNGSRRESSNEHGEILQSTDDGLGISGPYRRPYNHSHPNKLEQMVQELQVDEEDEIDESTSVDQEPTPMSPAGPPTAARAIPPRPKQVDSPLKLSVNENDGVIDIDIPLPGFGSPVQSPLMQNMTNSYSSLEGSTFGPSCCSSTLLSADAQHPVNVAGWLARFHQDFVLQGVNPFPDLEKDVKKAMSAEPTPSTAVTTPTMESGPTEKWVHICTTLIADARSFSVKRIHLKRRVRLIPTPSQPTSLMTPGSSMHTWFENGGARTPGPGSLPKSQYGNPYGSSGSNSSTSLPLTELHMEERFVEEPVMDLDETLVDAIERGVSLGTAASSSSSNGLGGHYSPHHHNHSVSASASNGSLRDSSRPLSYQTLPKSFNMSKPPPMAAPNGASSTTTSTSSSRSSSRHAAGGATANNGAHTTRGRFAAAPAASSLSNTPTPTNSNHAPGNNDTSDAASTITSLGGCTAGDAAAAAAAASSRSDCKSVVLGALEQIAKSVVAERAMAAAAATAPDGGAGGAGMGAVLRKESTLREGVRRWLGGVDALDAEAAVGVGDCGGDCGGGEGEGTASAATQVAVAGVVVVGGGAGAGGSKGCG